MAVRKKIWISLGKYPNLACLISTEIVHGLKIVDPDLCSVFFNKIFDVDVVGTVYV